MNSIEWRGPQEVKQETTHCLNASGWDGAKRVAAERIAEVKRRKK